MIEIKPLKNAAGLTVGLEANGHASDAPRGHSVVCASVSTLFEVLSTAAGALPEAGFTYSRNPGEPSWKLRVETDQLTEEEWLRFQNTLGASVKVAKNVALNYPESCNFVHPE